MYYQFNRLFIGTLAENQNNAKIDHGEILCVKLGKSAVVDLLSGAIYDYMEDGDNIRFVNGVTYVNSLLSEHFPKEFSKYIFKKETLIKLALMLNNTWTRIEVPCEEHVKIKRIG